MPGLEDYSSPILRCSVFRQLHPGAQISYTVVPIGQAFPLGHLDYEGKATEAVRCEIIFADGNYIVAHKEIDKKDNRNKDVLQTPENLAKDETKALGRALRDAGIPQRLSELKILMSWIASMNGSSNISSSRAAPPNPDSGVLRSIDIGDPSGVKAILSDAFHGSVEESDDSPDAGSEDPTPEQLLAKAFGYLNGADKQAVVAKGRELGTSNVLKAGEHADTLLAYLTTLGGETATDEIEEINKRGEAKRLAEAATIEPEEEVF